MKPKYDYKVSRPWPVNLLHTDVAKRIRDEQKRLADIAQKPQTVVDIKRKKKA